MRRKSVQVISPGDISAKSLMWHVAFFPKGPFRRVLFCQVSNGIKGSNTTDYAGLRLDSTGNPDIFSNFFSEGLDFPKKLIHNI